MQFSSALSPSLLGIQTAVEHPLPQPEELEQLSSLYAGRCYDVMKGQLCLAAQKVIALVQGIFFTLKGLGSETNTVASIFRKLDRHVIAGIEHLTNAPGHLDKLTRVLRHSVGLIDFMQVFTDADGFYNDKYKNTRIFDYLSKYAVTVADVGGALVWFNEMNFIHLTSIAQSMAEIRLFSFVPKAVDSVSQLAGIRPLPILNQVAAAIGELRVFSFMTKTSMLFIAVRALTLTYIFLAIDAAQRLFFESGTKVQKIQASLDLSVYLSELTLDALMTIGVTHLGIMGAAGGGAIALVVASFAYKMFHQEELNEAELIRINESTEKACAIT